MNININTTGTLEFVWTDEMAELTGEGDATVERASHVEPTPTGQWEADLSPVDGPALGPFMTTNSST